MYSTVRWNMAVFFLPAILAFLEEILYYTIYTIHQRAGTPTVSANVALAAEKLKGAACGSPKGVV